jgi:AraC-like DNA-binding protein
MDNQRDLRPDPRVQPIGFSTARLRAEDQLDAWRDHCNAVVEITEALGPGPGYLAQFRMWTFGHFALSAVQAPPTRFRRTARQVRRDGLDHWLIHVARSGEQRIQAGASEIGVEAGQPHIFSLDQVMEGRRSELDWLCLFVSRDAFPGLGPTIDARRGAAMPGAMGGLMRSYLGGLAESLTTMTEAELPRVAEATRAVVAACIAPGTPNDAEAEAHVQHARLARLRQIIRQNLRSTRLGPERLAKLAGMSRSQLYRMFEPFGGVARYIQAERLRQAHRALAEPGDVRDIVRVAEDFGFFDPSAFSRAFRREFGYSPSELRNTALAGCVGAPIRRVAGAPARDFAGALRRL